MSLALNNWVLGFGCLFMSIKLLQVHIQYAYQRNVYSFSRILFELWAALIKQFVTKFVCVEVLWPSQPNGVMSSAVSLSNHTFTGQA